MQENKLGGTMPWSILFDHMHHKDKRKNAHVDKKSKAVIISIHEC